MISPPSDAEVLRPSPERAFAAWSALVEANREQIERVREVAPPDDFWAGRARQFRPGGLEAVELPSILSIAEPRDTWLDIGAGGGRFAIPLARRVRRLVAVEPSPAMRDALTHAAADAHLTNVEILALRWPPQPADRAPQADASLAANVLYDNDDLEGFLTAMEAHTTRLCVVVLGDCAPSTPDERIWTQLHGEPPAPLPALPEFLAVLGALGRRYDLRALARSAPVPVEPAEAQRFLRRICWLREGSAKDARLPALLRERYGRPSGLLSLPLRRAYSGVVTWTPPAS